MSATDSLPGAELVLLETRLTSVTAELAALREQQRHEAEAAELLADSAAFLHRRRRQDLETINALRADLAETIRQRDEARELLDRDTGGLFCTVGGGCFMESLRGGLSGMPTLYAGIFAPFNLHREIKNQSSDEFLCAFMEGAFSNTTAGLLARSA